MMSAGDEETHTDTEGAEGDAETAVAESEEFKLSLELTIEDAGPCKKHIRVKIPQADIDHFREEALGEFAGTAEVSGFRIGHVPRQLVARRFKQELGDKVKQRVLVESMEQLAEENDLDPINEPNLDAENIAIPDQGDFEYEFDVEVRPDFELPDYNGLKIVRQVQDITETDVDNYLDNFLSQYGEREVIESAAEKEDYVTFHTELEHKGEPFRKLPEMTARLRPVLRFQDAELEGWDDLMEGAVAGDTREADLTVSQEAETLEMRDETVHAVFKVEAVRRLELPELTGEFLERVGVESEEELREEVFSILERQATYQQRQATREQVLERITESADWDLPEDLVLRQVDNALRRQILEMQQAGFTSQEIQARENELRQRAVSTTRQALKEHFVLDKIAVTENIEVTPADIDTEIQYMAMQRGESARRVRARMHKSGMIENLEAQIRERKAVDSILDRADFEDVEMERPVDERVEAVNASICGMVAESVDAEPEAEDVEPSAE